MPNYKKVFEVFLKNYQPIPLEVFHHDPYKALIATLLSARSRDETTFEVCKKLFKKAPDIYSLSKLDEETLKKLLYPVGFYKTKAKRLKELSKKIIEDFDGNIPNRIEDLVKLPGVGRKTANVVINRTFDIPAIAVDTHVHRISNALGWVNTSTPQQTEKELVKIVPKKYWKELTRLFVSVGRQHRSMRQLNEFLKKNKLTESK